jgi:hypothetical protein
MNRPPCAFVALASLTALAVAAACDPFPVDWSAVDDTPIPPATLPRVVAIGDLHGDLVKAREALRLAGAIDGHDSWIGGDLVVVQTGDVVDRGPYDREILDLLERLSLEAAAEGGAVHRILGNHEYRDATGLMSYVPLRGFWAFFDFWGAYVDDPALVAYPDYQRPRRGAMRPGEPYGRLLAEDDLVLSLDGTVYVHGSFLPEHADYGVDELNEEMRAFLRGEAAAAPVIATQSGSPMYSRAFGGDVDDAGCAEARGALFAVGAERMVIGHTVQAIGINSVCGGRVFRIDTGMSAYYADGPVEVLEITPRGARVLNGNSAKESEAASAGDEM